MTDKAKKAMTIFNPSTGASVAAGTKAMEELTPDIPAPPEEKVAPILDDEQRKRAIERARAMRSKQGGRASTILTKDSNLG